MNRWLKSLLALSVLITAFGLTFVWPRQNGLDFDIDSSPRAKAAKKRVPYDLSSVRVLKAIVTKVSNNYVEPERVDYEQMLFSGLNAIQKSVPPVLVHHTNGKQTFSVQVNESKGEFSSADVNSPWQLTWRFQEVFKFLQAHLQEDEDVKLRDVEYAAVNGMLNTLDPHSILLTPEEYSEMQLSTRGEFGGLGIVISIRDGQLTVIRPMPGTPAFSAGLKKKDRIVKINDESTLNMPLDEAVSRLRGTPSSPVDVWVVREGAKGWKKPRKIGLIRAVIHIASVESNMLKGGVGYVSIKNFQSNTCDDIRAALSGLRSKKMRGLVLDLRDNPGGLLSQAVCVSDLFLSSGTIVTTSSNDPSKREPKLARSEGTEPDYPIVVLSNGGSASASEIVAGALKNHDRALVVGSRTFGKGSVQVLYSDDSDGWALKLTIAQYLTPGDLSIQGVGIVPDIQIEPMTVDRLDMDLTVDSNYPREADLQAHLTHARARDSQKPSQTIRYYLSKETRQRLREARPEDREENEQEDEFLTKFSREILAQATRPGRRELLRDSQGVIQRAQSREMKRAVAELAKLGVNWSQGQDTGPSETVVEVSTNIDGNVAKAGDTFEVRVKVSNTGDQPLHKLRATTKSDNRLFAERELVFGRLLPGETKEWAATLGICRNEEGAREGKKTQVCTLPKSLRKRADGILVEFSEAHGHAPASVELRTQVQSLPRPNFTYTVHVADDVNGNGDGWLQPGETGSAYLQVENTGSGRSEKTIANLRNMSGRGILLRAGRFELGEMAPGDVRNVKFTFEVLPDYDKEQAKLQVSMSDTVLRRSAVEELVLPIVREPISLEDAKSDTVTLNDAAFLLERPSDDARQISQAKNGPVSMKATARVKGFIRVAMPEGLPAWVATSSTSTGQGTGHLEPIRAKMPPVLKVEMEHSLVTSSATLPVKGIALDDEQVRDIYIFVGARKVFYKPNHSGKTANKVSFETKVPLQAGTNYVTVVARESNEIATRETFVVRRDGPDGALLATPKNDHKLQFATDP